MGILPELLKQEIRKLGEKYMPKQKKDVKGTIPENPPQSGQESTAAPEESLPSPRLDQNGEEVIFMDDLRGIRKTIVDNSGNICHFPDILQEDRWTCELTSQAFLQPQIRFGSSFTQEADGRFLMVWTIQPDGRYWADDGGFGMEHDLEIRLYTHIDRNGSFTDLFRVYSVGRNCFY